MPSANGSNEPAYAVVWPLGRAQAHQLKTSRPIHDLSDATIGLMWDWLFKGDQIFEIVIQELQQRFPGVKFVDHTVFGDIHGPQQRELLAAIPDRLQEHGCSAVITAVGA